MIFTTCSLFMFITLLSYDSLSTALNARLSYDYTCNRGNLFWKLALKTSCRCVTCFPLGACIGETRVIRNSFPVSHGGLLYRKSYVCICACGFSCVILHTNVDLLVSLQKPLWIFRLLLERCHTTSF